MVFKKLKFYSSYLYMRKNVRKRDIFFSEKSFFQENHLNFRKDIWNYVAQHNETAADKLIKEIQKKSFCCAVIRSSDMSKTDF